MEITPLPLRTPVTVTAGEWARRNGRIITRFARRPDDTSIPRYIVLLPDGRAVLLPETVLAVRADVEAAQG
jgi:hypothetical protein